MLLRLGGLLSGLGATAQRVRLVAVDAGPVFTDPSYLRSFDRREGLDRLANWSFLTGTPAQLSLVRQAFGVHLEPGPGGSATSSPDVAFLLSPSGRIRQVVGTDPGPTTAATASSFAGLFAEDLRTALHE